MEIVLQQWMYIYIYNILYVSYFSYIYNIFIFWDAPPATVSTRIVTCMGPLLINFSLAIVIATGSIPGYIIYIYIYVHIRTHCLQTRRFLQVKRFRRSMAEVPNSFYPGAAKDLRGAEL